MKRFLAFVIVFFLGLASAVYAVTDIPADNPYIQYFGRWDFTHPEAPSHSWPGVYIKAKFEGTSVSIKLKDNYTYYDIFIDGVLNRVFKGDKSALSTYLLASNLRDTVHSILIAKRCETTWTSFSFHGFVLDTDRNLVQPDPKPDLKIEFVGDSYTSASGNEWTEEGRPSNVSPYDNVYEGFGPVTARHYDAQWMMTSQSGYGVWMDWTGNTNGNIPDIYQNTHIYTDFVRWDFSQWVPNLVVIGLGLNDYNGIGGWEGPVSPEDVAGYKSHYHDFIQMVRDLNHGSNILCVAPHVDWLQGKIREIVDEENAAGNGDVHYAQYSYYPGGYVNEGHPNVATHHAIAQELIAAIDTIDAWTPYVDTTPPVFTKLPASPAVVYDSPYELNVSTNGLATVRYSTEDKAFDDMEFEFDGAGTRDHSILVPCQQDQSYTLYLRAKDINGNSMTASTVFSFSVDTLLAPVSWFDLQYPLPETWKTGPTPSGYGFDDLISPTSEVQTVYYRNVFNFADTTGLSYFSAKLKYDDGLVLYLNGTELTRVNMDDDTLYYGKPAESAIKGFTSYNLPAELYSLLHPGLNLLAAEIHQFDDGANDLYFNCRLAIKTNAGRDTLIDYDDDWTYFDTGVAPEARTKGSLTGADHQTERQPQSIELSQNYPNPFNPATTVSFTLDKPAAVSLTVFNIKGQKVKTLAEGKLGAGIHHYAFDGTSLPSGLYTYRLKAGGITEVKKCLLLK